MCRVCCMYVRYEAKISILQSHRIYYLLERILTLLEMEVYRADKIIKNNKRKIIKNKKRCLLYQAKDVAHFLNEGQIYLDMASILHERHQNISTMFAIMLKAMDIYSKLKVHLRDSVFESDENWVTDEELSSEEEDSDDDDDGNRRNELPVGVGFEEEMLEFDEKFDINKICFCCMSEIYYREFLLANIESLITRIKSLCVAFTGSNSALYVMLHLTLRDYCERVRLFLHGNTRLAESRRGRLPRGDCRKYDLLEQLLERVRKEQEHVAKYADIKENGKFNNHEKIINFVALSRSFKPCLKSPLYILARVYVRTNSWLFRVSSAQERHEVMVQVLCSRLNPAIEVERSRRLYADLKSILILLESEQSQDYKTEKNKNLYLPDKINFDRFRREGTIYLSMVNNLINWARPNSTKNVILRKTMNDLGRVQFQYKRMLRMRKILLDGTVNNGIREDIIFSMENDAIQETDELRTDTTADMYDIDEDEIIHFYDWQSKKKIRKALMRMINPLVEKVYHVFIKRYLTLCSILKKYSRRATQFLHSNRKILKSSKLRRRQGQNSCCKYHFLKQLIASCHRVLVKVRTSNILRNNYIFI
ncbi:uncharacterized protein [Temnothorax nylanderi]|uniref:uncharacterized protein n=1 Tax=Temnothorax nylanderi TaxID=102681 RepID=UPI003A8AF250